MAVTRADLYWMYKRLLSALNGGTASTFTAVLDDPRRSPGELFASLQAADDELCSLLAETEGHGYRSLFMADSAVLAHSDTLPDHLGPVGQLRIKHLAADSDYKAAKFDEGLSLADIERWRANTGTIFGPGHTTAASSLSGYGIILGNEVYFTGSSAITKIATYTRTARDVTDGAMTTGSKDLTSATAVFVAGDVGAGVIVDGGGVAGVQLVSRIDSRTNGTTVVLRDANASGGNISAKTVLMAKLQTPQDLENGLLAIAMLNQIKRGDSPPQAQLWAQAAQSAVARIKAGQTTIPALEVAQAA